jgi:hypothetical protein
MTDPTPTGPPAGDPAPANPPAPTPTPVKPPADPKPADPAQDTTDWKAMARQWEKRAKDNGAAAEELEKFKAAAMTDAEKAVAAAKAEGRAEANKEVGAKLAAAEFKAALALAGVALGDATDLIDTSKFVTDKGDVDEDAIKKAVAKLAKLAPAAGPARSGAPLPGGPGGPGTERPKSLREAYARRNSG